MKQAVKNVVFPWGKIQVVTRKPERETVTNLIYYGGKSRDADWILSHFPHGFKTFVDVFGGGAGITFRVSHTPGTIYVYNDIGHVHDFMKVMRDQGEELFKLLYQTPFSRQEFDECASTWEAIYASGDMLEWARRWFVVVNQGYTHAEQCKSWHVAKQVNSARANANHVDDIYPLMLKLRNIHLEHLSFERLLPLYNLEEVFAYMDPPYVKDTRASYDNYMNEMPIEKHEEMLKLACEFKGQVVISGYDHPLYNDYLSGWRRAEKTAKSAIQNSSSMDTRGERTEVLWIKEHNHGLWHTDQSA